MKKIMMGTFLLSSLFAAKVFFNRPQEIEKAISSNQRSSQIVHSEPIVSNLIKYNVVKSTEEMEKDFFKKTDEEIKMAIKENNSWAAEKKFFAKANANELDRESASELLKYIRLNGALHKILLERQIEELEMERL